MGWLVPAAMVAFLAAPSVAAPGDLDPSFGDAGRVIETFGAGSGGNDVALAPDGGIVVAGWIEGMVAVMRFGPDGGLDSDFGDSGATWLPLGHQGDEANAVGVQPNGKIVIAGTDSRERFVVARFTAGGAIDPSFGGDGVVRTRLADRFREANDLVIQPNGRIVVVGWSGGDWTARFALVRYRADGRTDASFGDDGTVQTRFEWSKAYGVALQRDGKIVVTGFDAAGLAVARYLPDGRRDRSFGGGDGKVSGPWDVSAGGATTGSVAVRSNGRILLGGDRDIFDHAFVRLLPDGRLDRSFGGDGLVRVHTGCCEQAIAWVAPLSGGRVLGVGYAGPHEGADEAAPRFVAIRLLADGRLDDTWGGDGKVITRFASGARAWGAAMSQDGRIVAAGAVGLSMDEGIALARYLP